MRNELMRVGSHESFRQLSSTIMKRGPFEPEKTLVDNLVPRVSRLPAKSDERETLTQAGHVSPRIWEITNKRFEGGVP